MDTYVFTDKKGGWRFLSAIELPSFLARLFMSGWYRRACAAMSGACAAVLVFGLAFAASPNIANDGDMEGNTFYQTIDHVTDAEMEELYQYMNQDDVNYIKEALVDDANNDIIRCYIQMHPDFVATAEQILLNE